MNANKLTPKNTKKSFYAKTGMTKEEFLTHAKTVHESRKEKNEFLSKRDFILKNSLQQLYSQAVENHKANVIALDKLIDANYRASGSASYCSKPIAFVSNRFTVETTSRFFWQQYTKRKSYPRQEYYLVAHLPLFYELPPKHLQIMDGLLNIQVEYNMVINDCIIYKAIWIEQGQGYSIKQKEGYIALYNATYYHYEGEDKLVASLKCIAKYKKQNASVKTVKQYSEWKLTDTISRKQFHTLTGACYSGIASFCAKAGIEDSIKKIRISDVMPLLQKYAKFYYDLVIRNAPQLKIEEK